MTTTAHKERPIIFGTDSVQSILRGQKTQTRRVIKLASANKPPFVAPTAIGKTAGESWVSYYSSSSDATQEDVDRFTQSIYGVGDGFQCPYGKPGDRLWVRERFAVNDMWYPEIDPDNPYASQYWYWADDPQAYDTDGTFTSPIFMPRVASRILLAIKDVRPERLHSITYEDCIAEGIIDTDAWVDTTAPSLIEIPDHGFDFTTLEGQESFIETAWVTALRDAYARAWDAINGKRAPWSSNPWVWRVEFTKANPLQVTI